MKVSREPYTRSTASHHYFLDRSFKLMLFFLFCSTVGHGASQLNAEHVVISYESEAKDRMIKLKDKLTKCGYYTVMNDDQQGKSLENYGDIKKKKKWLGLVTFALPQLSCKSICRVNRRVLNSNFGQSVIFP